MSVIGNVAMPSGILFSPFKVTTAGHVAVLACNICTTTISVTNLGVRIVSFG
jgi:hypothetical protein